MLSRSDKQTIGKAALEAFGGSPLVAQVAEHRSDARMRVDIISCKDSPWAGVTSYATVGVSDIPLLKDGRQLDVRAELVAACGSKVSSFESYLAAAAFEVANTRFIAPGIIFPNMIAAHDRTATMRHFLFLPPFLWDERLPTMSVGETQLGWLLAIPISDAELAFALSNGVPALEDRFDAVQIDIFNLKRPSVF